LTVCALEHKLSTVVVGFRGDLLFERRAEIAESRYLE
jgi:hypothetical protein